VTFFVSTVVDGSSVTVIGSTMGKYGGVGAYIDTCMIGTDWINIVVLEYITIYKMLY